MLPKVGVPNRLVFEMEEPLAAAGDLVIVLKQAHGTQHTLGRFQIYGTEHSGNVTANSAAPPINIIAILAIDPAKRNAAQRKTLAGHYRSFAPELAQPRKDLAALKAEIARKEKAFSTSLVSVSMTKPRMVRVLPRGNWLDDSGEIVQPSVPAYLQFTKATKGRATRSNLAEWIVSRDNPLTARVMVNRLWAMFHGRGLAMPLDDFGSQGTPPTHPALLDWLAIEFMDKGWDVKHMVKLIVTSGTYRQTSVTTTAVMETDPYNFWLARQGRWRLEAEMVRDNALHISGMLIEKQGGPSVKPYQPAGLWKAVSYDGDLSYEQGKGDALYRRSLYTYWKRAVPPPAMLWMIPVVRSTTRTRRLLTSVK